MQGLFCSRNLYSSCDCTKSTGKDEESYLRLWDIWKRRQVNIIEVDENEAEIDPNVVLFHPNHWKVFSKDKVNEESLFYVEHGIIDFYSRVILRRMHRKKFYEIENLRKSRGSVLQRSHTWIAFLCIS